jgi:hypothetical protein
MHLSTMKMPQPLQNRRNFGGSALVVSYTPAWTVRFRKADGQCGSGKPAEFITALGGWWRASERVARPASCRAHTEQALLIPERHGVF